MKKACCFALLVAAALAAPDPTLIVPGQGFGAFTPKMNLAQVEKRLPQGQYMAGDGSIEIWAMEPKKRISIAVDAHQHIRSMSIHGHEGVWHTAQGVALGTPLATLEKLNGGPFKFRSLGMSDDAGRILDWQGGKLAKPFARVKLTFAGAMHSKGYGSLNDAEHQQAEADGKTLSSADPLARKLNPIVETLTLQF